MKFHYTLNNAYSWNEFYAFLEQLVNSNSTTGEQTEANKHFTLLNQARMKRLFKTVHLKSDLQNTLEHIKTKQRWYLLTESWCGDGAQTIPAIVKMVEAADNLSLTVLQRDQNLHIMDDFLTNGARSIPKLIAVNDQNDVLFTWGGRSKAAQEIFESMMANPQGRSSAEIKTALQKWYNQDKMESVQNDFIELLKPF